MRKLAVVLVCVVLGCGGGSVPQFSSTEQKNLLNQFRNQMPRHNVSVFEQLCKNLNRMHEEKQLTDEQYEALEKVCVQAVAGQWDRAEKLLKPLVEGQGN